MKRFMHKAYSELRWRRSDRRKVLLELPKASVGAEIGVHLGEFSSRILQVAAPKTLYLVDPWEYFGDERYSQSLYGGLSGGQAEMDARYQNVVSRFEAESASGVVSVVRGTAETLLERLQEYQVALDWIYIDGDHSYDAVKADLKVAMQVVRSGGVICGDDMQTSQWWGDGVSRAVREFCDDNGKELKVIGNQFIIAN